MEQPTREALFAGYVKLRRGGLSMGDAVEKLKPSTAHLSNEERRALGHEVMAWENGLGKNKSEQSTPTQTAVSDSALFESRAAEPVPDALDLPPICPKCGTKNSPKAVKCVSCGNPLKSFEAGTRRVKNPFTDAKAQLGDQLKIYLAIKGHKKPLEIYLRHEFILGRSSPDSAFKPDIDLAPYEGEKYGVSRTHASLKMQDNTVIITDLQSSNFTYVNGEQLHPHEMRVLRHGDELRLGELPVKVLFKL